MRGLLLGPAQLENSERILSQCSDDILTFRYDIQWTFAEHMSALTAVLRDVPLRSLDVFGWMFHGTLHSFAMVKDHSIDASNHQDLV